MSECDRLQHLSDIEATSDPGLLLHAETCPDCRVQLTMNGRLRNLMTRMPQSRLSPGFNRRLRTNLAVERRKQYENRRRLFLLRAYWVVAAVASMTVLAKVQWPSTPTAPEVYVLSSVLVAVIIGPALLLLRQRSGIAGFLGCVFAGKLNDLDAGHCN